MKVLLIAHSVRAPPLSFHAGNHRFESGWGVAGGWRWCPNGNFVLGGSGGVQQRDPAADEIGALLRSEGAGEHRHAGGRSLLDHLTGTYDIVRRWEQPPWLQHAALLHSVYGTDAHHQQLLPVSRSGDVREVAGDRAERLAYLFAVTPRRFLFAGTHRWAAAVPKMPVEGERVGGDGAPAERDELDALVLLHMANIAEQAQASDGSPGVWLVRLKRLAELLLDSEAVTLPWFVAGLASISEADEGLCGRAYRAGFADLQGSGDRMAQACAACPVVPEPCVVQAYLARCRGEGPAAAEWARIARRRLVSLGTTWDKRLTFDAWLELAQRLGAPVDGRPEPATVAISDPRALFAVVMGDRDETPAEAGALPRSQAPVRPAAAGERFQRYMEALADAANPAAQAIYPDLESRPWFDPATIGMARYLQSHFGEIREEILSLDASRFHRESERIGRSGDWDVAFFYERGRRHDDVCAACPVTTGGIEAHGAMRTLAGLIYVSRMRAGTHIAAHRGPTNVRLRCHLGITVPSGDCAIRVDDEVRRWTEGQCLIFDDHFEHEAWNHTDEDRVVLIVDMWHPALSAAEVCLLQGLHRYAGTYARQLNRYWARNAEAAARA